MTGGNAVMRGAGIAAAFAAYKGRVHASARDMGST